jgi:4-amino-4-deoxy-L-arabinose transferase-like glycosyltransferase
MSPVFRQLGRVDWQLTAILIAALALRVLPILQYNSMTPNSAALSGDEPQYAGVAHNLLRGYGFVWPGRVPLYPVFVAAVFWLGGESYHLLRIVQAFLGVITVWITFALGLRLCGRSVGLLAALLAASTFPLCDQGRLVLSENLFTPVLLVLSWVTLDLVQKPGWRNAAILGVLLGICDLTRPTLTFYPLFLILALPFILGRLEAWRLGAVATLAAALTILPWTIHNYVRFHAFLPLQTANGLAIWTASPEYARIVSRMGYMPTWHTYIYGPGWQAHDPTSVQGDRYWIARGLRSIREEPFQYARLCIERIATFWIGDPAGDWLNGRPFSYRQLRAYGWTAIQALRVMVARFLAILALLACVALWRHMRSLSTIYMLLVFVMMFHAVAGVATARYSEPFQPFVCLILAAAFYSLTAQPRSSVPVAAYVATV